MELGVRRIRFTTRLCSNRLHRRAHDRGADTECAAGNRGDPCSASRATARRLLEGPAMRMNSIVTGLIAGSIAVATVWLSRVVLPPREAALPDVIRLDTLRAYADRPSRNADDQ